MGRKYQTWRRIPQNDPVKAIPVIIDALRELSDDPTPGAVTQAELEAAIKKVSSSTSSGGSSTLPEAYVHTQAIADTTWTVTHNMLRNPSVVIVDSGGSTLWADVTYLDPNSLSITFSLPVSGKAYCN